MNIEAQKKHFANHVATLTDYGNIKILDFKNPKSSEYRIRFLFEEDYCRLHISGDLGELIATNYNNMTYEGFKDFVNSVGYFEGKIDCHSRPIYVYDEDKARENIKEHFSDEDVTELCSIKYDSLDELIDDVMDDFSEDTGIGSKGYDILSEELDDVWDFIGDIGKKETGILDLYMLAFTLAQEQLKEQENWEKRYKKVIDAIGHDQLLELPDDVKTVLKDTTDLKAKVLMLEDIAMTTNDTAADVHHVTINGRDECYIIPSEA